MGKEEIKPPIVFDDRTDRYIKSHNDTSVTFKEDGLEKIFRDVVGDTYGITVTPPELEEMLRIFRDPKLDGEQTDAALTKRFPHLPNLLNVFVKYMNRITEKDTTQFN